MSHVTNFWIIILFLKDSFQEALIENCSNKPLEFEIINSAFSFPKANSIPINEFSTSSLCSLIFPKLFPTGKADPTKISI